MGSLFQILMGRQVLRPVTRVVVGLIAIPLFRLFLRRIVKLQELNDELEKDLEQWFRGSLILLVATANMEQPIFGYFEQYLAPTQVVSEPSAKEGTGTADPSTVEDDFPSIQASGQTRDYRWILLGLRIMMAIGVIQAMPDQELFAVIHPGPPRLAFTRKKPFFLQMRAQFRPFCKGFVCKHLNQSSPVFAILAAIADGWVGWLCYFMAISQYLIIGLVTSRDRAYDVLSVFDEQVAKRRRELIEEFDLEKAEEAHGSEGDAPAPVASPALNAPAGTSPAPPPSQR
jgi:hypothetical protein